MEFQYLSGSTPSNKEIDFAVFKESVGIGGELKCISHLLYIKYFILHNLKIS